MDYVGSAVMFQTVAWSSSCCADFPSLSITSSAMRLDALHLMLLAASTSAIGTPDCVRPAPHPSSLPTIADCEKLLQLITVVARMQRNMPLTWSRHPPGVAGQKLPAYFSYGTGNECEFVVDARGGSEVEHVEDVFPTGDVVFVGRDIVETCLVGEAGAEDTVGSDMVGPRGVVELRLRKKGVERVADGSLNLLNGTLLGLNGTDESMLMRTLERVENVSGIA